MRGVGKIVGQARMGSTGIAALAFAWIFLPGNAASAADRAEPGLDEGRGGQTDPFRTKPGYAQLFVSALVGDGVRMNNPYRLATPLGHDAESLSRSAMYADFGLSATFGHPLGLQHGVSLRTSVAIEGIRQVVMVPSYFVWRRRSSWAMFGRGGPALVLTPQPTLGLEASCGAAWFITGGIGIATELVGDIFYGTGTPEVSVVTYPMLSAQAGLILSYEVLP